MNKTNGKPQNDRDIYDSISSLIKAQGYELDSLLKRGRDKRRFYSFNLLTIADTELVRLRFHGDQIDPEAISSDTYVGRYIVNQEEVNARVNLARASHLDATVSAYDEVHKFNYNFFREQIQAYYRAPFADYQSAQVFKIELERHLLYWINRALNLQWHDDHRIKEIELSWNRDKDHLQIGVDAMPDQIARLNSDERLNQKAKSALASIYRYEGPFAFEFTVPF